MAMDAACPPLGRLPFIDEDPKELWEKCVEFKTKWKSLGSEGKFPEAMADYCKQRALNVVWHSNQLEGTLPNGISQQQTYRDLEGLYNNPATFTSDKETEQNGVDAEKGRFGRRQLVQHMRAYLHCRDAANSKMPLSEELIRELHGILMKGLETEDGSPIDAGQYRQELVHAGEYVFPPHHLVPDAMTKTIENYNRKSSAENHDPFELASWLLYQVVTIHPFQDGNGRLCRLLASYSLMRDGLPFPVSISSGRSKAYKHYVTTIVRDRERGRGGQPHLTTLTVYSVWRGWNNFCINQQYNPAISEAELKELLK